MPCWQSVAPSVLCFVAMIYGGCTPACNLDNPSDFPTAGMLYVRAGLQFATRYMLHHEKWTHVHKNVISEQIFVHFFVVNT